MAVMGLRLAGRSNGVAKLHGDVSRKMFADLWPDVPVDEVPITSITNGVHARTWVAPEIDDAARRATCCPTGTRPTPTDWARGRRHPRRRAVAGPRAGPRARWWPSSASACAQASAGPGPVSVSDVAWTDAVLDPQALTIGFARRFATYKRATLLLSQPDRLQARCCCPPTGRCSSCSPARPTRPTTPGKELIRQIERASPPTPTSATASCSSTTTTSPSPAPWSRAPTCGSTPRGARWRRAARRGMKAALNGGLNCSILDGWWDEWFDGDERLGHLVGRGRATTSTARDELEAGSLFDLLEHQIVPLFYERVGGPGAPPVGAAGEARARHARPAGHGQPHGARLRRRSSTSRPPRRPTPHRRRRLRRRPASSRRGSAGCSTAWARRARRQRRRPTPARPTSAPTATVDGRSSTSATLDARRRRGAAPPRPGRRRATSSIEPHGRAARRSSGDGDDGLARYEGGFRCDQAGRYGFTVRVVPRHPGLDQPGRARPHRLGLSRQLASRPELAAGEGGLARARARGSWPRRSRLSSVREDVGEQLPLEGQALGAGCVEAPRRWPAWPCACTAQRPARAARPPARRPARAARSWGTTSSTSPIRQRLVGVRPGGR